MMLSEERIARAVERLERSTQGVVAKSNDRERLVAERAAAPEASEKLAGRLRNVVAGNGKQTARDFERILGTNDLVDINFLERGLIASRSVGRIVLFADGPEKGRVEGYATGFMRSDEGEAKLALEVLEGGALTIARAIRLAETTVMNAVPPSQNEAAEPTKRRGRGG